VPRVGIATQLALYALEIWFFNGRDGLSSCGFRPLSCVTGRQPGDGRDKSGAPAVANSVGDRIKRVANEAEYVRDANLFEHVDQSTGYCLFSWQRGLALRCWRNRTVLQYSGPLRGWPPAF
jgi:hypothetical protein